jgi:hypothetical protein
MTNAFGGSAMLSATSLVPAVSILISKKRFLTPSLFITSGHRPFAGYFLLSAHNETCRRDKSSAAVSSEKSNGLTPDL